MNDLESNKAYYIGDFIIKLSSNGILKIAADRGVISIRPKADNAVEINSSKGK